MKCQAFDSHIEVFLEEVMKLASIQEQFKGFKEVLEANKPILLRGESVTEIDAASLQLLLSFILATKQKKIECKWQSPSSSLKQAALLMGLHELLGFSEPQGNAYAH